MKAPKRRRAGKTETFSVSVDASTKKALRNLADAEYAGNLSALVTDFAEEARRRMAAGAYLRSKRLAFDSSAIAAAEADIAREVATARKAARGRRSA